MRLFFSFDLYRAYADVEEADFSAAGDFSKEALDPMNKIKKDRDKESIKNEAVEKICSQKNKEEKPNFDLEKASSLVAGYPIEAMLPYIGQRDQKTAHFLIAIAKKESDWGKHAPSKSGRDCYNYWGYKGNYNLAMGYSCFDSPEHAIEVVGNKIDQLIAKKIDTPARMVVWKCGSSCAGHSPESVQSWIGTVDMYIKKMIS